MPGGRKKLFEQRITLPLTNEMMARIDGCLEDKEARVELIRSAIERELDHRERQA